MSDFVTWQSELKLETRNQDHFICRYVILAPNTQPCNCNSLHKIMFQYILYSVRAKDVNKYERSEIKFLFFKLIKLKVSYCLAKSKNFENYNKI